MTEPTTTQTFVLVHGAWHGGWCWRRVANLLQHEGHTVYTPTLTGLADRSHLMSRMITLDTHIADIVNLFRWEELDNVVLCAHSYAGWVVAGALETIHDKVKAIVLLDAHFPRTGERGVDASNLDLAAGAHAHHLAPQAPQPHVQTQTGQSMPSSRSIAARTGWS